MKLVLTCYVAFVLLQKLDEVIRKALRRLFKFRGIYAWDFLCCLAARQKLYQRWLNLVKALVDAIDVWTILGVLRGCDRIIKLTASFRTGSFSRNVLGL